MCLDSELIDRLLAETTQGVPKGYCKIHLLGRTCGAGRTDADDNGPGGFAVA